jgi:hypothetical protein
MMTMKRNVVVQENEASGDLNNEHRSVHQRSTLTLVSLTRSPPDGTGYNS